MYDDVKLNEYGFYSLKKLPSKEEVENYYKEKYYQKAMGSYEITYTEDELSYFNAKLEQKLLLINLHTLDSNSLDRSFLDIGCGEGFALSFFKKKHFSVLGLDYSSEGVIRQNPDVADNIIFGDLFSSISKLIDASEQFDIVNMDNLLEHVAEPKSLLQMVKRLLKNDGLVIIKVPNDFSFLQEYFYKHGIANDAQWVAPLDHISYFNNSGLIRICSSAGFECIDSLSDSLVELSALNPNTNYFLNKNVGKSCHMAMIAQENIFHGISPNETLNVYRVLGEMGIGRAIIGVFKKLKST